MAGEALEEWRARAEVDPVSDKAAAVPGEEDTNMADETALAEFVPPADAQAGAALVSLLPVCVCVTNPRLMAFWPAGGWQSLAPATGGRTAQQQLALDEQQAMEAHTQEEEDAGQQQQQPSSLDQVQTQVLQGLSSDRRQLCLLACLSCARGQLCNEPAAYASRHSLAGDCTVAM